VRRILEVKRAEAKAAKNRRGPETQEPRRELERTMRRRTVAYAKWAQRGGADAPDVADTLGLSDRTLREWRTGWEKNRLRSKPAGRPAYRADTPEQEAILAMLGTVGPTVSVAELQALFPKASRRGLAAILEGYRDDWTKRREKVVMALRWKGTGRVWAIDFTDPPTPVEGIYPKILVIRDLASGYSLLALPCLDATEKAAVDGLAAVLKETDAPLVLKSDNGSHFTGEEMRGMLKRRGIVHLVSPPGTPRYNGAVEAGIGSLKTRTHIEAARQDRPGQWTCDDVEKARRQANEHGRPRGFEGASPCQMWYERERVYDNERSDFQEKIRVLEAQARAERGVLPGSPLPPREQDNVDRVAISRACVASGYLFFRRRRIPLRISDLKKAVIS
jgi:transposase InsO family protein